MTKKANFSVSSLYGVKSDQALVQIDFKGELAQMTPTKAREIAFSLLECAAVAEVDAACYRFGRDKLGEASLGGILVKMMREHRQGINHND